jgi:4-hydroxybenzoate polyprenyltransferase
MNAARRPPSFDRFQRLPVSEMSALIRTGPPPPSSLADQAKTLLMLGRPRTCVPGLLAYGLGLGYSQAGSSGRVLLGGLLSFLVGFSANLHNTYTDIDEDCRNLPGRMYLLATLGRQRLLGALVAVDAVMVSVGLVLGGPVLAYTILAVAGLHQYSFPPLRLKTRPFLGLYVFAQAVVFPFLFGYLADPDARVLFPGREYLGMMAFLLLWFMAKGAFKNVPDFDGDRAAGIRTSATVFATRRQAAAVAAGVTIAAYLSPAVLVAAGLAPPRLLLCLPWVVPAAWQGWQLLHAEDGAGANQVLRADMLLSCGFLATVLLLQVPGWRSVVLVIVGGAVLAGTDLLRLDSRRDQDTPTTRKGS